MLLLPYAADFLSLPLCSETLLNAAGKLLDSYTTSPLFKSYDRTSKEFRRRSVDATLILGGPSDIQPSDPTFVIRRAAYRGPATRAAGPIPTTIDELEERQQAAVAEAKPEPALLAKSAAAPQTSVVDAPAEDIEILARATSPQATRQEIIAAQRAVSRANQRALLSAQKNEDQGVDISIPNRGVIRSTKEDDKIRYSFVDQDGKEVDISQIVENEWAEPQRAPGPRPLQPTRSASSATTGTSTDAESFRTAPDSLTSERTISPSAGDSDDEAVAALRDTNVDIESDKSTPRQADTAQFGSIPMDRSISTESDDVLQDALGPRMVSSPLFNESLQDRLDRVLAKVKEDKALGRRPGSRPRSFQLGQSAGSTGRMSPASVGAGRISPQGRRSPDGGRDSPSIDQLIGGRGGVRGSPLAASLSSRQQGHGKKASLASMSSTRSANSDQPSTPITAGSGGQSTFTPATSNESRLSNHPRPPPAVAYRDDFGLETLVAIVDAESNPRRRPVVSDDLFGVSLKELDVHPDVASLYSSHSSTLEDMESVRFLSLFALVLPSLTSSFAATGSTLGSVFVSGRRTLVLKDEY